MPHYPNCGLQIPEIAHVPRKNRTRRAYIDRLGTPAPKHAPAEVKEGKVAGVFKIGSATLCGVFSLFFQYARQIPRAFLLMISLLGQLSLDYLEAHQR